MYWSARATLYIS